MPLSPADQALIADMKQRELHLKSRQRATDAILYEVRRYRTVCVALVGVVGAAAGAGIFLVVNSTLPDRPGWWRLMLVNIVLGAILGVQLGQSLLRTPWGRRLLAKKEGRLRAEYTSELHAGRRWQSFYYQDEDISAYVPQILYFIEGEQRFDSVRRCARLRQGEPAATTPRSPWRALDDVQQGRGADQPGRRLECRRSWYAIEPRDALRQVGPTRRVVRDDRTQGKQGPRVRQAVASR